jgi:hypothetical protein
MQHDEAEAFLAHYGKKGMKWGVTRKIAARDASILSARTASGTRGLGLRNLVGQSPNQKAVRSAKQELKKSPAYAAVRKAKEQRDKEYLSGQRLTSKEIAANIIYAAGAITISAVAAKLANG